MKKHRIVHIKTWRGIVEDVKGLPHAWTYEVVDFDDIGSDKGERKMAAIARQKNNLGIAIKWGVVYEVGNLPAGYKYQVSDVDSAVSLNPIKGGRSMKKRGFKKNPVGVLFPALGILLVGGVAILLWKPWKSRAIPSGGKTTLSQAEIATLYQQWLAEKKTNPGGVTGWLNTILSGVNNALQVANFFNAQKGGGGQGKA